MLQYNYQMLIRTLIFSCSKPDDPHLMRRITERTCSRIINTTFNNYCMPLTKQELQYYLGIDDEFFEPSNYSHLDDTKPTKLFSFQNL